MTNKKTLIASGCAIITAVGIGAAIYFMQQQSGLAMEANATIGAMPGVDEAARRKQLQEMLDKSKIAFSVNSNPFMNETGEINLLLENPSNNQKLLTAQIALKSGNETIYESKAIAPGSYLENVSLSKKLSSGSYDATIYLKAFDMETQEPIGQTGAEITITVP